MAFPRVGNGTEAATQAQDVTRCSNGDACQAAGVQGPEELEEDGRRRSGRRGLGSWKKSVSRSRPAAAAAVKSGPQECAVSAGARDVEEWAWAGLVVAETEANWILGGVMGGKEAETAQALEVS